VPTQVKEGQSSKSHWHTCALLISPQKYDNVQMACGQ